MAIVRLAYRNVLRRLSRSFLSLLATAIAAAVLTSGMSMSQGTLAGAYGNHREYFKGEMLVFTPGFVGLGRVADSHAPLIRVDLIDSGFSPLLKYHPGIRREGYIVERHWQYRPLSAAISRELSSLAGITSVTPHLMMPAQCTGISVELKVWPQERTFPQHEISTSVGYDFEIVINGYDTPEADVGDILEIMVPMFNLDQQGIPYVDWMSEPVTYRALVVDTILFPTRQVSWMGALGEMRTEEAYVHSPDLYLEEEVWHDIWRQHSGGIEFPPLMLSLKIESMSNLNTLVNQLREQFPQLAIYPITEFVEHLNRGALLDRFYEAPRFLWSDDFSPDSQFSQQDFSKVTAVFLFINAGMMLASQMLASISGRRRELGILKAIGARQREVVLMVVIESAILAVMGAFAGFTLVRVAALHQAITNKIPLGSILATTFMEMGIVIAATLCAALLFGVLPAVRVSRLTVMDVFRSE